MARSAFPPAFRKRLKDNRASGKAARRELGRRLAEMNPREVAKLPRSTLMRIGSDGLATMARVAARNDDILPAEKQEVVQAQATAAAEVTPLWLLSTGLALLVAFAVVCIAVCERPARWALARTAVLSSEQAGLCARLDRWTDDCVYRVDGSILTLSAAAARLHLPVDDLAALNPGLSPTGALAYRAAIHIHRFPRR